MFGSRLLSRLLFTVFVIYAASRLGPDLFGAFSFVLALVELLSSVGDMGLTRYGARELIRHPERKAGLAGEIFVLQVLTSVVFSLVGVIVIIALAPPAPKLQLLLLGMMAIFMSCFVNTAESVLIASQNFFYSSLFNFLDRLVFVALGLIALSTGASVIIVMWCFVAGVVLESLMRMVFAIRKVTTLSFRFPARNLLIMFGASIPFAIGAVASMVFLRVNVIILGFLEDDAAVGIFNVAYTIFLPVMWIPVILARTMLPGFTEAYQRDPDAARRNSWQWYRLLAMLGIPAAMTVTLLAGPALSFFPSDFSGSITVLIILMWSVPMMVTSTMDFVILQVVDQEKLAARVLIAVAAVTVALNFVLIPLLGINGAAIATLGGTAVRQALFYRGVYLHFIHRHIAILFVKPAIAGLAMAAVALPMWSYNHWLASVVALAAYAAVILMTGGVRPQEIKALLRS